MHAGSCLVASPLNRQRDRPVVFQFSKLWNRRRKRACDTAPHCGASDSAAGEYHPQCGAEPPPPHGSPPGSEYSPVKSAETAILVLEQAWTNAPQCGVASRRVNAKALALEFRRHLQRQPGLVGCKIASHWVRQVYPLFCQAQRAKCPPPYKDFARELKLLMPRRRGEHWHAGTRIATATWYLVPDPHADVVMLAEAVRMHG